MLIKVYPTRTVYQFDTSEISLTVTFMTPAFIDVEDYDMLSLPVTYIGFDVSCNDNQTHSIQLYYDNTGELCVNDPSEEIIWQHNATQGYMFMGTQAQDYFAVVRTPELLFIH